MNLIIDLTIIVMIISVCWLSRYLQLPTLTFAPVTPKSDQMQKCIKYPFPNPEQIRHEYG